MGTLLKFDLGVINFFVGSNTISSLTQISSLSCGSSCSLDELYSLNKKLRLHFNPCLNRCICSMPLQSRVSRRMKVGWLPLRFWPSLRIDITCEWLIWLWQGKTGFTRFNKIPVIILNGLDTGRIIRNITVINTNVSIRLVWWNLKTLFLIFGHNQFGNSRRRHS